MYKARYTRKYTFWYINTRECKIVESEVDFFSCLTSESFPALHSQLDRKVNLFIT